MTRLHDKMSCILEEIRIQMDPAILTVCTVHYNMGADQHAVEMNTKVRSLNETIRKLHQRSVLPLGLLDVAEQMELSTFPDDASADGIHFDRPRGLEWLNNVFQRHICALEAELLPADHSQITDHSQTHPSSTRGLCPVAWARGLILETVRGTAGPSCRAPRPWRLMKRRRQLLSGR